MLNFRPFCWPFQWYWRPMPSRKKWPRTRPPKAANRNVACGAWVTAATTTGCKATALWAVTGWAAPSGLSTSGTGTIPPTCTRPRRSRRVCPCPIRTRWPWRNMCRTRWPPRIPSRCPSRIRWPCPGRTRWPSTGRIPCTWTGRTRCPCPSRTPCPWSSTSACLYPIRTPCTTEFTTGRTHRCHCPSTSRCTPTTTFGERTSRTPLCVSIWQRFACLIQVIYFVDGRRTPWNCFDEITIFFFFFFLYNPSIFDFEHFFPIGYILLHIIYFRHSWSLFKSTLYTVTTVNFFLFKSATHPPSDTIVGYL